MRVLFVSAEVSPFAKAGGLADVALALPRALAGIGVEPRVVMPKYRAVAEWALEPSARFSVPVGDRRVECEAYRGVLPGSSVPIYFLGNDPYYDRPAIYGEGAEYSDALERFTFLSRGALRLCDALDWRPQIVHANDWHTALIPAYLRSGLESAVAGARSVLTIHNLAYQGNFPRDGAQITGLSADGLRPYERGGRVVLLRGGILTADRLTTVSPTYAKEILANGEGLEAELKERRRDLHGIRNGVDTSVWDPATDSHLWANYDSEDLSGKAANKRALQDALSLEAGDAPVVGMISRLAEQKGFDLVLAAFERLIGLGIQFVLLGTGASDYEEFFRDAEKRYPGRVAARIMFSEEWAHRIEAGADIFLMPSRFEPCGLNQQYSLRYGTVPVVRATGGLVDTVSEHDPATSRGNGFLFSEYTPDALFAAVERAVTVYRTDRDGWRGLIRRGMEQDFSWEGSARAYRDLYRGLVDGRG